MLCPSQVKLHYTRSNRSHVINEKQQTSRIERQAKVRWCFPFQTSATKKLQRQARQLFLLFDCEINMHMNGALARSPLCGKTDPRGELVDRAATKTGFSEESSRKLTTQ